MSFCETDTGVTSEEASLSVLVTTKVRLSNKPIVQKRTATDTSIVKYSVHCSCTLGVLNFAPNLSIIRDSKEGI